MAEKRIEIIIAAKNRIRGVLKRVRADVARTVKRISTVGLVAGGAAAAGLAALTKRAFETIDATSKLSDRLGIATDQLVGLQHAASISGASSEKLGAALEVMQKRLGEVAIKGTGAAKDALEALNLNVQELIRMSPDEQFKTIAEAISGLETQSEKAAATANIFSRANQDLLNTLELGRDGLEAMRVEARELGLSFSRFDGSKIEAANDAITRMKSAFVGMGRLIAIQLAGPVEKFADQVTALMKKTGGAIANLFSSIAESGLTLIRRAAEFITRNGDSIASTMEKVAATIRDVFRNLPEIVRVVVAKIRLAVDEMVANSPLLIRLLGTTQRGADANVRSAENEVEISELILARRLREQASERRRDRVRSALSDFFGEVERSGAGPATTAALNQPTAEAIGEAVAEKVSQGVERARGGSGGLGVDITRRLSGRFQALGEQIRPQRETAANTKRLAEQGERQARAMELLVQLIRDGGRVQGVPLGAMQ